MAFSEGGEEFPDGRVPWLQKRTTGQEAGAWVERSSQGQAHPGRKGEGAQGTKILPPLSLPPVFPSAGEAHWLNQCNPQRPACQGSEQSGGAQRVGLEGQTG